MWGKEHFTSTHGQAGLLVVLMSIGAGLVGGIFLHPDFGAAKTNKQIRAAHKLFSRTVIAFAWATAFYGYYSLTKDPIELAVFAVPLLALAPFTLM